MKCITEQSIDWFLGQNTVFFQTLLPNCCLRLHYLRYQFSSWVWQNVCFPRVYSINLSIYYCEFMLLDIYFYTQIIFFSAFITFTLRWRSIFIKTKLIYCQTFEIWNLISPLIEKFSHIVNKTHQNFILEHIWKKLVL